MNAYQIAQLQKNPYAATSSTPKSQIIGGVPAPRQSPSSYNQPSPSSGYKTAYLNSGGSVVVRPDGSIDQYGGQLSNQQASQMGGDNQQNTINQFDSNLANEYKSGQIKNTFDFIPGQGTQWATGQNSWSPFAVDLQTAARNSGQIPAPQSAQSSAPTNSPQSASSAGYGIPTGGSVPPLNPNITADQKAYFDNTYGGFGNYDATQQARLNDAYKNQDFATVAAIQKDLGRFNITPTIPSPQPQLNPAPQGNYDQLKQQQDQVNAAQIAQRQNQANNYIQGLQNSNAQSLAQINDNRVLENNQFNRLKNPFSGRTSYDKAVLNRQRTIADQNMAQDLQNRIAGAQQGVMDYSQTLAAQEPQAIQDRMHQQLQDSLAVNNQQFNQGLETKKYDLNKLATMADLTQTLPDGTPTYQAVQDAVKNGFTQQQIEQTAKQFAEQQGYNWAKLSQDQKQFVADMAIKNGQLTIDQQNANTSSFNAQTSRQNADSKSNTPSKNDIESTYVSNIDRMTPVNRKKFFTEQKANLIKDLGVTGYNQLYGMYYDPYGTAK